MILIFLLGGSANAARRLYILFSIIFLVLHQDHKVTQVTPWEASGNKRCIYLCMSLNATNIYVMLNGRKDHIAISAEERKKVTKGKIKNEVGKQKKQKLINKSKVAHHVALSFQCQPCSLDINEAQNHEMALHNSRDSRYRP